MIAINKPMPKSCAECFCTEHGWCYADDFKDIREYYDNKTKPESCPLIELSDDGK